MADTAAPAPPDDTPTWLIRADLWREHDQALHIRPHYLERGES